MKPKARAKIASRPAAPAVHGKGRPHLRVLGTEITLLEGVRRQAEKDLGISISFELLDFLGTQQKAARLPAAFDIYDQCFHNLDIVWFWRGVQPIDTGRIAHWQEVSDLTKRGRLNPDASIGHGDAPVNRLYVQPDETLGAEPSRHISMLPTVHNFDSFAYDPRLLDGLDAEEESWAWLLDRRWAGKAALVDEPAIGIFDAALAAVARREMSFVDMGNMSLKEIDGLVDLLSRGLGG
jgi:putative spermidine/putrescine transport system substrate-binding protein